MDNIILGSLLTDNYGNLKGSFDFNEVKTALVQALADTKVPGRVRFQVLHKRSDNSPFLTVGGVGEFGGGGSRQQQTRSDPGNAGSSTGADNSGANEWN
jgi:hypothetical protein